MGKIFLSSLFVFFILCTVGYKIYDSFFYSREFLVIFKDNNIQGNAYHRDDCKLLKSSLGTIIIVGKEFIARKEFRPCQTCKPPYDTKYVLEIRKVRKQEEVIKKEEEAIKAQKALEVRLKELEKARDIFLYTNDIITPYTARQLLEYGFITKEQYEDRRKRK